MGLNPAFLQVKASHIVCFVQSLYKARRDFQNLPFLYFTTDDSGSTDEMHNAYCELLWLVVDCSRTRQG